MKSHRPNRRAVKRSLIPQTYQPLRVKWCPECAKLARASKLVDDKCQKCGYTEPRP